MIEFNTKEENLHFHGVIDIDPKELATMLEDSSQQKQIQLIDVRQPDEFNGDLGHIPGATLMVLDTLPDLVDKVDKDKTVVFVCRSGGRSARAAAYFLSLGYKNVFNLKGGMLLWSELHLETEA